VRGEVLAADPFGNLLTSVREGDLGAGRVVGVEVGGCTARFVRTFGDGEPGELVALVGSSGRLELAVREGSAREAIGGARGTPIVARLG
jgi:S-adenosylmethionine hydrolase